MKNMSMSKYEFFSLFLQTIQIIVGLTGALVFNNTWFLLCLAMVPITVVVFSLSKYKKQKEYIQFIECLNFNNYHDFRLLPLLRMYIHKYGNINRINLKQVSITYTIVPSERQVVDKLYGDCQIKYVFKIENYNLPKTFYFMSANDFSNIEPEIKYRIGTNSNYSSVNNRSKQVHPYWGGKIKPIAISLDNDQITVNKTMTIEIIVSIGNLFEFKENKRDTIICLPLIYSENVEQIDYSIDVSNFTNRPFYCDVKRFYIKQNKHIVEGIPSSHNEDGTFFTASFCPDNKLESAYYFRLGLSEHDPDDDKTI